MKEFKKAIFRTAEDVVIPPPGIVVNIQKAGGSCDLGFCGLTGTITNDTVYTSDGNITDLQFVYSDASLTSPYSFLGFIKKVGDLDLFDIPAGQAFLACTTGGGC